MNYAGIDLHKRDLVVSIVSDTGAFHKPVRFSCREVDRIEMFFKPYRPFKAVIEASASYRWLYDLLRPLGEVVLAHPLKLRAIVSARAKTDKLDSELLARLLQANLIPTAYIPPEDYQRLRDLARTRARLSARATTTKNELHALLARRNIHPPTMHGLFSRRGLRWLASLALDDSGDFQRDELLERLSHYERQLTRCDERLSTVAGGFKEIEAIRDLHGIGLFSALLIVGELGEPERFRRPGQVGAYAGLTARVRQSGGHCYHGRISKQGSP